MVIYENLGLKTQFCKSMSSCCENFLGKLTIESSFKFGFKVSLGGSGFQGQGDSYQ